MADRQTRGGPGTLMPVRFVDTNVFLRFLTRDNPGKFERCRRLFEQAVAGSVALRTSELVIAEIVWTLLSYYALPKAAVIEKVGQILNTPNLAVTNQEVLIEALVLWSRHNCELHRRLQRRSHAPRSPDGGDILRRRLRPLSLH
jgi:predicted nucleic acid-binding protein